MLLKSQNGWPAAADPSVVNVQTFSVPVRSGTLKIPLRAEAAPRLIEMLKWWDQNIEPIAVSGRDPAYGTWGYNYRVIRGSASTLSNHASGTAIDINAPKHALGERGTIPADKVAALRAKAASLGLRWGGEWTKRPDEMHFEINFAPPADVTRYSEAKAAGQTVAEQATEVAMFARKGAGETYRTLKRNWIIVGLSLAAVGVGAWYFLSKRKKQKALPLTRTALRLAANPRRRRARAR